MAFLSPAVMIAAVTPGLSAQRGRHARRQNLNGWHALETRGQNGLGAWDFLKSDNFFLQMFSQNLNHRDNLSRFVYHHFSRFFCQRM